MRKLMVFLAGLAVSGSLLAEHLTLPTAASIVGAAPFFSDVRVFNTSYTDISLEVHGHYRCFIGPARRWRGRAVHGRAARDPVLQRHGGRRVPAPNTAGGIEFE